MCHVNVSYVVQNCLIISDTVTDVCDHIVSGSDQTYA